MNKTENTKNCWLVSITSMVAIIGLIIGLVYYSNQLSASEAKHTALQDQVDRLNNVVKERLKDLDRLVEEKVKRLDEIRQKEDAHSREIMDLKINRVIFEKFSECAGTK